MDRYAIALGKKPPPTVPLDKVSDKEWVDIRRKQQQNENMAREFLRAHIMDDRVAEAMRDGNWNTDRTP